MVRLLAALLALSACDTTVDWFVSGSADYGKVFICEDGCIQPSGEPGYEYCWDGDADELGELLGTTCRAIDFGDRFWPALVGCAYSCHGELTGPGANAHCGTACR